MNKILAVAAVVGAALVGPAPVANAQPYTGPYCDPSRSDYYYSMCKDEFQNDPDCSEFGDMQDCQQDFSDFQRQQRELTPTPN